MTDNESFVFDFAGANDSGEESDIELIPVDDDPPPEYEIEWDLLDEFDDMNFNAIPLNLDEVA